MTKRVKYLLLGCIAICTLLCSNITIAQTEKTLCEVTVTAIKPERFMVGLKVRETDSLMLAQNRFNTLAGFLQFQSPASFKSYGAGQLATISFRGTSANHTAVLWNGVNINMPSLGQSDFSTLPLSGFDEMSIQYGSAASCVGTDAVGGSVLLRSVPKFSNQGLQAIAGVSAESSENYSSQAGLRYYHQTSNDWKISGKTLLYGSLIQNDFGLEPIKNKKGRQYPVEPIKTTQIGLVNDLFALQKNGNLLSLNLWLTDNNLVVQPQTIALREITRSQANRLMLSYNLGKTLFRTAYIRDIMNYGRAENLDPSHTDISRYIGRAEHDFSWIQNCDKGINLKVGAEYVRYQAAVDGYGGKPITENRADFYALLRSQFSSRFVASLNLRQALVQGFKPPFTPSAGVDYRIINNQNNRINLTANIAYSYRVPTLNERYWVNLGNPNLKPEIGFNKEAGIVWQHRKTDKYFQQYGVSVFHNLIDNWTYWNPDKNYKVENLQQVLAKGLELEARHRLKINKTTLQLDAQYALTHSSQQKAYGPYTQEIIGKQLVYVPRHTLNGTFTLSNGNWNWTVQQLFNSKRYITFDHSGSAFPPYSLINSWVGYQHLFRGNSLHFQLQGNNLTNTLYPNLKKNAMPMRSVSMNIILVFNHTNQ
ncbi:TonB-dependent receptor plug domain-containing protein [Jiulongibacter sp. NS-SX5]|uniref:TonB-dependent receptor plug domain-containing protein n=1 Tax=Jiulongibacter sp. NS-SX5 TaxID=3463854 RepID=UPI00405A4599